MRIKTPTEFLTFTDGLCEVWSVKANALSKKICTICFGDRSVSLSRYVEASQMMTGELSRTIQVLYNPKLSKGHSVVIEGVAYRLDQVQHLRNTNPPASVLYLSKIGEVPKHEAER